MTNEDLITEARAYLDREGNVSQWPNLVSQLADALEQATARLREAEKERDDLEETRLARAMSDLIELCPAHRGSYGTCDTCAEYLPCSCSDCECREIHIMPNRTNRSEETR